ncbi:MAG TPA: hypothetical protein VG937_32045 [Polyangiaceae bacterium]|nr:hypothetical protein [Polyangiaceae bacterium]
MATALTLAFYVLAPKVSFGCQRVVSPAAEGQIQELVFASESKRAQMVNLEVMRVVAAQATSIDIGATPRVALVDSTPNTGRNMPSALMALSWCFR